MSLKFKYDQTGKNKPEKPEDVAHPESEDIVLYKTEGNARKLCLVLATGKRISFNYAYLMPIEFDPENNIITLTFSPYIVTLKGNTLEKLFEELDAELVKTIKCVDKRYVSMKDQTEIVVTEIVIKKNET